MKSHKKQSLIVVITCPLLAVALSSGDEFDYLWFDMEITFPVFQPPILGITNSHYNSIVVMENLQK